MKENLITRTLGLMIILGAIVLTAVLLAWNSNRALGSVDSESGGYYSTSTTLAVGHAAGWRVLTSTSTPRSGIFGSIVVTGGPKAGNIQIYDATTTDVNKRTGNVSSSTILLADLPSGTASTTYVFDSTYKTGLIVVTSALPATSTITWK